MTILVIICAALVLALLLLFVAAALMASRKLEILCATCAETEGDRQQLHATIYGQNIGRHCDLCGKRII